MTDGTGGVADLTPEDDAAVAAMLASLPGLTMPEDVAQRVHAALAEQEPLSGPVPAWAAGDADNVTVLPSPQERARRKNRGLGVLTGVAASVVVLVGVVVVGTHAFPGGSSGGGDLSADGATTPSTQEDSGGGPAEATLLTSSGAEYDTANLDTQVAGLVSAASAPNAPLTALPVEPDSSPEPSFSPSAGPTFSTAKSFIASLAGLRVCLRKLDRPGELPIAADGGSWESKQAVVFVFRGDQPARVDVYIVEPTCGDSNDPADHLLYFETVATTP